MWRLGLAVVAALALLAGCGGGGDEASTSAVPEGDRSAVVELMTMKAAQYIGDPEGRVNDGVEALDYADQLLLVLAEEPDAEFQTLCGADGFVDRPIARALARTAASIDRVDPAGGDGIRAGLANLGLPTTAPPLCDPA